MVPPPVEAELGAVFVEEQFLVRDLRCHPTETAREIRPERSVGCASGSAADNVRVTGVRNRRVAEFRAPHGRLITAGRDWSHATVTSWPSW
jgi:hypothetical protein